MLMGKREKRAEQIWTLVKTELQKQAAESAPLVTSISAQFGLLWEQGQIQLTDNSYPKHFVPC